MTKTLLWAFLLLWNLSLLAQVKYEHEVRARRSEVPEQAREWVNEAFRGFKRVRWYRETTLSEVFYEAKFRWSGYLYSVKFTTEGLLVDIEKRINEDEMDQTARSGMHAFLNDNFQKHRILKIQRQTTGEQQRLMDFIRQGSSRGITFKYEVEFQGVSADQNTLYEALFDLNGHLVLLREMVVPHNFNLDF